MSCKIIAGGLAAVLGCIGYAASATACSGNLPTQAALHDALVASVKASGGPSNGGLDFNMWASIVDRDGVVCAVAFSGGTRGDQWPGSRVIAAQKANTGNAFSLDSFALSSGNLYGTVQPGGSLFGLQFSNPVDPAVAYRGDPNAYGTTTDPMVGGRVGGINVFGGGLALYSSGKIVGGLGVSGDTSCADHNVAWRVREALGLAQVPGGVNGGTDGLIYVKTNPTGFEHPDCGNKEAGVGAQIGASTGP
ncbi:MAG TPA: heme-binding protein [Stellaceae bacterium]|jgi:uncharacterized protein GlcG (DUF336 family)